MASSRSLRDLMRLPSPNLKLGGLKLGGLKLDELKLGGLTLGRSSAPQVVGLDIQPGYIAAVEAHVNGSVSVQRAAGIELPADVVREGEVVDGGALSEALRELFRTSHLDKHVRIGVANQRTVLRVLELPPITDRKELEAAVRFQAADEMPMPLENATLDFHSLGVIDTPVGQRQRVVVVAAQREMIERLLNAVRNAGLRPQGIDLSAFALIRSLHAPGEAQDGQARVLYLNVGGLTNMAIAEGTVCRFTRVLGGDLESIAGAAAAAHSMPLSEARELLAAVDLTQTQTQAPEPATVGAGDDSQVVGVEAQQTDGTELADPSDAATEVVPVSQPKAAPDMRPLVERGLREIAGEVRNSLEFHRLQEHGGEVSEVVLSGPALAIAGFAQALEGELGVPVRPQSVGLVSGDAAGSVPREHLAVATGLAVEEAPR